MRAMGGDSFVLAIKIKYNDFSDKNIFLPDAVTKKRSETLLEGPIKSTPF